jgi:hypothetical protein
MGAKNAQPVQEVSAGHDQAKEKGQKKQNEGKRPPPPLTDKIGSPEPQALLQFSTHVDFSKCVQKFNVCR